MTLTIISTEMNLAIGRGKPSNGIVLGALVAPYCVRASEVRAMTIYSVRLGRPGGGASTFTVIVSALTPAMARFTAEGQYPGLSAQSVRSHIREGNGD